MEPFFHHGGTESTEGTLFLPDRETAIGQKNEPSGHDPVAGWFYAHGWRHAIELSPKAEALFPGRRLPAREKISLLGGLCVSVVNPRSRLLRPS
jgi:hypothetical protein